MAAWLAEQGENVTVVTSYPYYPNWKVQAPYKSGWYKKEVLNNGKLTVYRCPFYVPATPSGLKRVLHEASFFASAALVISRLMFKQSYTHILCIAPPFHLGFLALYYRLFKGGKINYHIQDMQIEAARDLQVIKSERIFKILFGLERFILKRVNTLTSISEGMIRKISLKAGRQVGLFPNWVDTTALSPLPQRALLKPEWGFSPQHKLVLYSGSIGEKQGLDTILDIAVQCKVHPEIRFVICGTGPYKERLQQLALEKGADNLFFLPLQETAVFNRFLNMADVHLVLQKSEAADLVMPSKLTGILSAGGLVIATANQGTSLYDVIHSNQMGILIPPENNDALKEAIVIACKGDYTQERLNARRYAEKYLDKDAILKQFMSDALQN